MTLGGWFRWSIATGIALLGVAAVWYVNRPIPQAVGCDISGSVFDPDDKKPLTGVRIDFYANNSSRRVKIGAGTTDLEGKFTANCLGINRAAFPLRIQLSNCHWHTDIWMSPTIKFGDIGRSINLPFRTSTVLQIDCPKPDVKIPISSVLQQ